VKVFVQYVLPPLVPLLAVMLLAELLVRGGVVKSFLLPAPSAVIKTIGTDWRELSEATAETARGAIEGFSQSIIAGLIIAIALSSSAIVQRALYPYAVFFQTVPIIAIAPLLVIWFGFGLPTVRASAFIVSIFPIIANTLTGLRSTDPALRDMFRLYRASGTATLMKLRLPSALPNIMTGLRIGAGLAVIGAIVGEFIGGGGLGSIVDVAKRQQRTDKVFAAVLLASLLGLALFGLVNFISWLTLRRWHASEQAG